jgi:hypothetical protein
MNIMLFVKVTEAYIRRSIKGFYILDIFEQMCAHAWVYVCACVCVSCIIFLTTFVLSLME